MTFHNTSNLRLEVEVDPEGLANLVRNPEGELGSWGWVTPVDYTYMTPNIWSGLQFGTTISQPVHFATEYMAMTPNQYVSARFQVIAETALHNARARLEFYNSSKVLISSSTQSADAMTWGETYFVPAALSPAGTAFVRLRFDFYKGASNPDANSYFWFKYAMVTSAATTGELQTTRTNLVANPSFETNVNGWTGGGTSISSSTFTSLFGGSSLRAQATRKNCRTYYSPIAVSGGKSYAYQAHIRRGQGSGQGHISIDWLDADGVVVAREETEPIALTTSFAQFAMVATAPSEATHAVLNVNFRDAAIGDLFFVDAVLFERGTETKGYFDGSNVAFGGKTYLWNGTAHASTSKEVNSVYDYVDPGTWQNILGPTHEIGIERKDLDVGILSATILDALLDPAIASTIRPGRNVRLMALTNEFGDSSTKVWEPVYTGRLTNAHVSYPRDKTPGSAVETRIQITASDNIAVLANQGEGTGVASIPDLSYLLEGKGVPWNINGSGAQVIVADRVSWNENASVLDQVAITKDSNLGKAWVNRRNVLCVQDKSYWEGEPVHYWEFTDNVTEANEVSYTDIDVDFDLDRCINSVQVNWLRYDIGNDSTTEIAYGPYVNRTSIDKWGARTATYTIHGATESASAIQTYAQSILSANANPKVKANKLVMPVRNAKELSAAVYIDLMNAVHVKYSNKVNTNYAVAGIKHSITPDKWTVEYSFGDVSSVAAPTWTPSPPFKGADTTVKINCTGDATGSFTLVKNGHVVTMFGYCDYDTLNTGSNAGTFAETGAVVPEGWRPTSSFVSAPYAPYNSTGVQYRYRINTQGTTDGKVLVQRTATNGTFMSVDSLMWEV